MRIEPYADEHRLINTIAHEFCHLVNLIIPGATGKQQHGKEFKACAAKVMSVFGERGVEVTTTHSYEIEYLYMWKCEDCGKEYGRQRKTIDIEKHVCGVCKGNLVQTKPVTTVGREFDCLTKAVEALDVG